MADATGKLARWQLRLSELEFDVVHRAVIKHQAADALSRLETSGADDSSLQDEIPVLLCEATKPTKPTKLTKSICFLCDGTDQTAA